LVKHAPIAAEDEEAPTEEIWLTADAETAVHWIEDELIGVGYIAVRGADAAHLAKRIQAEMPTDGIAQLRARAAADRDPDLLIDTLYRTAVAACFGFDPEAFALLRWGLNDPDPLIRRVALLSVSILGWGSFADLLEEVSNHDPVGEVRDQAARVRQLLQTGTDAASG
jgi:hypothetical protein